MLYTDCDALDYLDIELRELRNNIINNLSAIINYKNQVVATIKNDADRDCLIGKVRTIVSNACGIIDEIDSIENACINRVVR